jgi:hypothetical protein
LRDISVQLIEDAGSAGTSIDYYPVQITKWPTVRGKVLSGGALVHYVRRNLNRFVDHDYATFWPLDQSPDEVVCNSENPVGAVMGVTIRPDDGAVVVAEASTVHWRFVTVTTPWPEKTGTQPVSGTREFGIRGSVFYTRRADRATRGT